SLFVRDISDVGGADEGDQMVLAGAVDLDVAHQHHLVVISVEYGAEDFLRMLPHPGKLLGIGPGDPARRAAEPVAVGILADGDEDLAHRALDAAQIHARIAAGRGCGRPAGGIQRRIRRRVRGSVLWGHPSSLPGASSWLLPERPAGGTDCPFAPA